MGLVVQPGPADMRGRGVVEELFLDGVPVEPGDGAQPPSHGRPGTPFRLQFAGERLDVRAADGEQRQRAGRHQPLNCRRSRVYASRVRPRYPAR